jgi:hypothetical protein
VKRLTAIVIASLLAGCAAAPRETSDKLQTTFVGKPVAELVALLGPPASTFNMPGGDVSYQWNVSSVTNMDAAGGRGWAAGSVSDSACKVRTITDPKGTVKTLNTEDANVGRGLLGAMGAYGGMCARYFGIAHS